MSNNSGNNSGNNSSDSKLNGWQMEGGKRYYYQNGFKVCNLGKNAILKGTNYQEGATMRERNQQIGGHRA